MAQPQPGLSGGRQNSMISIRLDDELQAAVESFAAAQGVTRSTAMRVLLGVALNEPSKRTAAREVVFEFSALRKRFLARLMGAVNDAIPGALAATEAEAEEIAAS